MQNNDFISYEYKTVHVKAQDQPKAMDLYEAFGWEITSVTPSVNGVVLSLKRDRRQKHKQELNKLERQAQDLSDTISRLQKSKTLGANIFAYTFGICSALVLGGGMSLALLQGGNVPAFAGGIILGVVGIVLCGINYPIYKGIAAKKIKQVLPLIDDNEEQLANLLEKGNGLLNTDLV